MKVKEAVGQVAISGAEKKPLFLIYSTPQGDVKVNVTIKDETIWVTQKVMAELFDVDRTSVSRHLKNIFEEEELDEKVVSAFFTHTTPHGAIADKTQKIVSDFDKSLKYLTNKKK